MVRTGCSSHATWVPHLLSLTAPSLIMQAHPHSPSSLRPSIGKVQAWWWAHDSSMISLVESTSISFGLDAWTSTTSSFHWGDTSANSPSTSHALLSDLLLPSTSAESLHDQLVMTLSNTGHWATGSSGGSLCSSSLDWVWVQAWSELQWALRSGAQHLMDCASTTDQPFPLSPMPFGHQSPLDLGDDHSPCVSTYTPATIPNG